MANRLLVIGIDALDYDMVHQFKDDLPNIQRIMSDGVIARMNSVWPPDSETAWATIYTGWNPARHGILEFVDPLEKSVTYLMRERDNLILRGHTFWDLASTAGRKVAVVFPHIGYPAWRINGVMISRSNIGTEVSVSPPEFTKELDLKGLNEIKGLAGRKPAQYLDQVGAQVMRQLELNLHLLRKHEWDLFFTYWSALDLVQHQFWSYCDPEDPTYPGANPLDSAIRDFYKLHDEIVGRLLEEVPEDTTVIILSDHGHGMRPVQLFNINRFLRNQGLLKLKNKGGSLGQAVLLRHIKKHAMDFIGRHNLGDLAAKLLRLAPWTKKLYLAGSNLDPHSTIAYATDMSGVKAYSYGGIQIARENLSNDSYDAVCDRIISEITQIKKPDSGNGSVVRWIRHRSELYEGPFLNKYPDLVFELDPEYGAGWDGEGPLFDRSNTHNIYPGTHLGNNAVFLLHGPGDGKVARSLSSLMDVAPSIMDLLDVEIPSGLDGQSIFAK